MTIEYNGKRFPLRDVIEDVIDDTFNGDEDFIVFFTLAIENYLERKCNK